RGSSRASATGCKRPASRSPTRPRASIRWPPSATPPTRPWAPWPTGSRGPTSELRRRTWCKGWSASSRPPGSVPPTAPPRRPRRPPPLRPVAQDVANPLLAEAHYAAGLRAYFAGRFGDAESAFIGAVEADNQDARYFYFLGLIRLALNKVNEANTDFEEGA